jgi:hypothetical protein
MRLSLDSSILFTPWLNFCILRLSSNDCHVKGVSIVLFPREDGHVGVGIIIFIQETGLSEVEVLAQLQLHGIDPTSIRDETPLFPRTAIELVKTSPLPIPSSEGYLTLNEMIPLVGRREKWIKRALDAAGAIGEYRRDSQNRIAIRYARRWVSILRRKARLVPPAKKKQITIGGIARQIGWVHGRVQRRLHLLGIVGEICRDRMNREREYFPAEVLALFKLLNIDDIARELKLPFKYVKEEIASLEAKGEERTSVDGKVTIFYPPTILDLISPFIANLSDLPPTFSKYRLTQEVCIGTNRLDKILEELGIEGQKKIKGKQMVVEYFTPNDLVRVKEYLGR